VDLTPDTLTEFASLGAPLHDDLVARSAELVRLRDEAAASCDAGDTADESRPRGRRPLLSTLQEMAAAIST
jgi:hypothetical protein